METTVITKDNIYRIFNELLSVLEKIEYFDITSLTPLGSTRLMLQGKGKDESKDLDFAIKLNSNFKKEELKDLIPELEIKLKEYNVSLREGDSRKIIFSNVITLYLNQDENTYQIDLMISDNNKNNFSYLTELRFYSNETKPFLKGLHRTELIRSMLKAKGLSIGTSNINKFGLKANGIFNTNEQYLSFITKKFNSAHKEEIQEHWKELYDLLEKLNIKDYLTNNNILRTRYGFVHPDIEHTFTEGLFEKIPYKINNRIPYWKNIVSEVYSIKKNFKLDTFEEVLIFLKENHTIPEIGFIIRDYISELKRKTTGDFYNEEIKNILDSYLCSFKVKL